MFLFLGSDCISKVKHSLPRRLDIAVRNREEQRKAKSEGTSVKKSENKAFQKSYGQQGMRFLGFHFNQSDLI